MSEEMPVIEARDIVKTYNLGEKAELTVLKGINIKVKKGDLISIMGPSGSGKTTLLDILGCLLKPTSGKLFIDGVDVSGLRDSKLAKIRGRKIGFVFQQYNLIPSATASDNVELPMRIAGKSKKAARRRALELLKMVGLEKRVGHRPGELSGGEQQRVAIARALANEPEIILADEPTGNLDTKNGEVILNLLKKLNREKGYTILLISHDRFITRFADKVINLKDGEIIKRT